MPTWSPTGEQILFASDRDRFPLSRDLYPIDPDGKNVRRVFGKSKDRSSATWSPDGKQIAYRRREPSGSFVYIATMDGKNEEKKSLLEVVLRGRQMEKKSLFSPGGPNVCRSLS